MRLELYFLGEYGYLRQKGLLLKRQRGMKALGEVREL